MNYPTLNIDLKKIAKNYTQLLRKNKKMIAVIKNNAYGFGIVKMAEYLASLGVDFFAVFSLYEAKLLRSKGIKENILILGLVSAKDLAYCQQEHITITIGSLDQLNQLKDSFFAVDVHLKIDTGMHRLGIAPFDTKKAINLIISSNLKLKGIYTHYIGGEECLDYIRQQQLTFEKCLVDIDLSNLLIHDCSSHSLDVINCRYANAYRIGFRLYENALSIKAPIINIIKVKKYQCVSYDCSFVVPQDGYILTVPFGYGDGWLRDIPLTHPHYIQAGVMTMNETMFFSPTYPKNTMITIFSPQHHYSHNHYELFASLNPHLIRLYE